MRSTGTWLDAMARGLLGSGKVELGIVAPGEVATLSREDYGPVRQYIVPRKRLGRNGLPSASLVDAIVAAVNEFAPHLVHSWGTEAFWGLLTVRNMVGVPALLEMQGLMEAYSRVYGGGLTRAEQRACIGFRELIRCRGVSGEGKRYRAWGRFEREMIAGHQFITTQSPWVEAWVRAINPRCKVFHTEIALREPFYHSRPWEPPQAPAVFCTAACPVPYKGLHDAIRALAILKSTVPNVRLRIAGSHQHRGIRQFGYVRWLNRLAKSLNVSSQIDWLGALAAEQIVQELQHASVMLMPSHCETYCVALAEAMYLGVPTVTTYNGGSAWLTRDEESAVFFPRGDEMMCAYQLARVLLDRDLATRLSLNSRRIAAERHDLAKVVQGQLSVYQRVVTEPQDSVTNS